MTSRLRLSLLEELDNRQDEVLAQLDDLNDQVEELLSQWTVARPDEDAPPQADAGDNAAA